ncbi:MAG: PEP/pyruvate-binding domain-containing protein [Chitinispirillia bacterium]|jgi:hypothetical protein
MQSYMGDSKSQIVAFHDLMQNRVRDILLVSNLYDAFVLEEDGGLVERIFNEYADLNLSFLPRIHQATSAHEALNILKTTAIDLVIAVPGISGMNIEKLGIYIKSIDSNIPIILLTYKHEDIELYSKTGRPDYIDKIFCWTGDARILLAIIKYIEDKRNVDNDITYGVRVILVVEDSPRYSSIFLPMILTEIMTQTRALIHEGINNYDRLLIMRTRPKILMAESYENAVELFKKYKNNLLGVISDAGFPRKGKLDKHSGIMLARRLKKELTDIPFLIQSSDIENKKLSNKYGLAFLDKNSDNLLHDLHIFIEVNFGFGDFVFTDSENNEYGRAKNISEFTQIIRDLHPKSLLFHSSRNHFSIWLRARAEFECADKIRPKTIADFDNTDELRLFLLTELQKILHGSQYGVISDFGKAEFYTMNSFMKLGNGSLGGKARGLAFLNALIAKTKLNSRFEGIDIRTPNTVVLCSNIFDRFMQENDLYTFAVSETGNMRIARKFMKAKLSSEITGQLKLLLETVEYPLAVRSSSMFEDSQSSPFAGLYSTYMLPNNNPDLKFRLKELSKAIKLIYASVFYKSPKEYVRNMDFRIEEEKMSIIIQQVVGRKFDNLVYPIVSGVAQSYNFYPVKPMKSHEGIVQLTLGLGSTIVEGRRSYRFSPEHPNMTLPFSSVFEFMDKSQSSFYALDISNPKLSISPDEKYSIVERDLTRAEKDGSLFYVGSTLSIEDEVIRDTLDIPGPKLVTFANILKYNIFPLSEILHEILSIGRESFGSHIEIEFALNLYEDKSRKPEFVLLQVRPMVVGKETVETSIHVANFDKALCVSHNSLGNGLYKNIYDLVYVDPDKFDSIKTSAIAKEIGEINEFLINENRNYILIGFGRWGTSDKSLGIPVEWHQISNARIVVESNLKDFYIDPSLGSHFFHNLTSLGMGYMHIPRTDKKNFIRWEWIKEQRAAMKKKYVKHLHMSEPFDIRIDAQSSQGIILKPVGLV